MTLHKIAFPSTVFLVALPWIIFIGFLLQRGSVYLASLFILISFAVSSLATLRVVFRQHKEEEIDNNIYINSQQIDIASIYVPGHSQITNDLPPSYNVVMGKPPSYTTAISQLQVGELPTEILHTKIYINDSPSSESLSTPPISHKS